MWRLLSPLRFVLVAVVALGLQAGVAPAGTHHAGMPVPAGCAEGVSAGDVTTHHAGAASPCKANDCADALCLAACAQAGVIAPADGPVPQRMTRPGAPAELSPDLRRGGRPPHWLRPPQAV